MPAQHATWDDIYECVRSREYCVYVFFSTHLPAASPEPSSSRQQAPGWHTNDADVTDFGPSRLDDDVDVIACPDCGKAVLSDAYDFHKRGYLIHLPFARLSFVLHRELSDHPRYC